MTRTRKAAEVSQRRVDSLKRQLEQEQVIMAHRTETHPLDTSASDLIAGLKEMKRDLITKDKITAYMAAMPVRAEALLKYVWWSNSFYTRNLIYRDDLFEV